jgi:hypothetical protein
VRGPESKRGPLTASHAPSLSIIGPAQLLTMSPDSIGLSRWADVSRFAARGDPVDLVRASCDVHDTFEDVEVGLVEALAGRRVPLGELLDQALGALEKATGQGSREAQARDSRD